MLKFVTSKTLFVLCFVMGKHTLTMYFIDKSHGNNHSFVFMERFLLLEKFAFNPLSARIFTVFEQFITGQSVTQRRMDREAPRYPPQYPGP